VLAGANRTRYFFTMDKRVRIASFVMSVCAVTVVAQGISFGRWNQWAPMSHFVNLHAALITAAGVALVSALVVIRSLIRRIERLERLVASSATERPSGS
jgi:hypothetical protein